MGSSVSAVSGSSLIAPSPDGRSSRLSSSDGAPGERRPYACSLFSGCRFPVGASSRAGDGLNRVPGPVRPERALAIY
jgi:hypothetical protein